MTDRPYTFYEFFAGGGMARIGLGARWRCAFANDVDPKKAAAYADNFDADHFSLGDVAALTPGDLPGRVDLAWASFPCQDLSLAGGGRGLKGARSGVFWAFYGLMTALRANGRAPRLIVLENVCGLLTSRGGADFGALVSALAADGRSVGALVLDAAPYTAQSRPRLFMVAADADTPLSARANDDPDPATPPPALRRAVARFEPATARAWRWLVAPPPPDASPHLADLIERAPNDVAPDPPNETARLLAMMSPVNRARVDTAQEEARRAGRPVVGALYRRTRPGPDGRRVQRAEARFDGLAGCLRTPAGGSSRQRLIIVEPDAVRTRLVSAREAARLMGLPDTYRLPARYNDAYKLLGDGVSPPVVRALARDVLEPLLKARRAMRRAAA
ncbi:MAG: DNA cytosine methyltransferase [Pseudomonadota bacterium]